MLRTSESGAGVKYSVLIVVSDVVWSCYSS